MTNTLLPEPTYLPNSLGGLTERLAPQPTPNLGLVCITHSDEVRFRALTRTRLLQRPEAEQPNVLRELYTENLRRLEVALDFCVAHSIRLYRMSSALFPFSDLPIGEPVLSELNAEMKRIGEKATTSGIRLIVHPEQFVVLSSDNPQVIENSVKMLLSHAHLLDAMAQPRSHWATMIIHGGKGDRSDRLVETIESLPDTIRMRLALENDEDAYGATEILEVCHRANVPMIFDAHHHICHEKQETYDSADVEAMFWAARATWSNPDWQIVHISNGREKFCDTKHSDLITTMPSVYRYAPWIEVEAKAKENAIALLTADWLPTLPCEPAASGAIR